MAGQLESTPLGVFRLEADVQSYHTCSSRLILNASEKELHSTNDHSKRVALADDIPQRLQNRSSFRRKAEEISTLLPPALQHRQNIIHFPSPPLQHSTPHEGYIATSVPGITDQTDNTNLKCHCSPTTICSYRLITQSTLMDPLVEDQETSAAAVVTRGSPLQLEVGCHNQNQTTNFCHLLQGGSSCHGISIILEIHQRQQIYKKH